MLYFRFSGYCQASWVTVLLSPRRSAAEAERAAAAAFLEENAFDETEERLHLMREMRRFPFVQLAGRMGLLRRWRAWCQYFSLVWILL